MERPNSAPQDEEQSTDGTQEFLTFTLGTLFSLNMLATPADPAVAMAASAASGAKVVSRSVRAPQG